MPSPIRKSIQSSARWRQELLLARVTKLGWEWRWGLQRQGTTSVGIQMERASQRIISQMKALPNCPRGRSCESRPVPWKESSLNMWEAHRQMVFRISPASPKRKAINRSIFRCRNISIVNCGGMPAWGQTPRKFALEPRKRRFMHQKRLRLMRLRTNALNR